MKKFINTLENWQEQILNYFFERVTNGFVEGMNGAIRIIIRRAFGYRNFESFRLQVLAEHSFPTNPRWTKIVKELLFWSYANLAMAHTAVERNQKNYASFNYMIRARLFKGLTTGSMNIRTISRSKSFLTIWFY